MTATRFELPLELFTTWLASGERGLSSEAMAAHLTGKRVGAGLPAALNYPFDADDFRRCVLLLDAVPLARLQLHRMSELGGVWALLVEQWDELEELLREEVGNNLSRTNGVWAKQMSTRIRQIIDTERRSR